MLEAFDAYTIWLGIPTNELPPNHYRLLGIAPFESDCDRIANAADERAAHVRAHLVGRYSIQAQKIFSEIVFARLCLLDGVKKAEYDAQLRRELAAPGNRTRPAVIEPQRQVLPSPPPPPLAQPQLQPQSGPLPTRPAPLPPPPPNLDRHESPALKFSASNPATRRKRRRKLPWQMLAATVAGLLICASILGYAIATNAARSKKEAQFSAQLSAPVKSSGDSQKSSEVAPSKTTAAPPRKVPSIFVEAHPENASPLKSTDSSAGPAADGASQPMPDAVPNGKASDAPLAASNPNNTSVVPIADGNVPSEKVLPGNSVPDDASANGRSERVYLDEMVEAGVIVGLGELGKHGNGPDGNIDCRLFEKRPEHALFPHPPENGMSFVSYRLSGRFSRFNATAAIADGGQSTSLTTFRVRGDGRVLWESGPINHDKAVQECNISVEGVELLSLEVQCAGNNERAWTVWFEPYLVSRASHASGQATRPPDAAAQEAAVKVVREFFKDKYASATKNEQQKQLVRDILQKAGTTDDDRVAKYAMLKEAGRLAMQCRDVDLTCQVCDEMGDNFEADSFELKVTSLTALIKSPLLQQESVAIIDKLFFLMDVAATKEQLNRVKQLYTLAVEAARKSKDVSLQKETAARKTALFREMDDVQKTRAKLEKAFAELARNPTDPAANGAVGRYYCFERGNWTKGLPMLAAGDDPGLKFLVAKDIQGSETANDQAYLGDTWWEVAETKSAVEKKNIRNRAATWYQRALPGLKGSGAEKVAKRLSSTPDSARDDFPIGKWVDVTPWIDPGRHAVQGEWQRNGAALLTNSSSCSRVVVPVLISGSYDLLIELTTLAEQSDSQNVIVPIDGKPAMVVIDGWKKYTYLDYADGVRPNEHSQAFKNRLIRPNLRYAIEIGVRVLNEEKVSVEFRINATPIFAWSGKRSVVQFDNNWTLPCSNCVGFGAHNTSTIYHSVQLRRVSGRAKRI